MHGEILSNLLKQDNLNLEIKKENLVDIQIANQNNSVDNRECIKPVKKVSFS